MPHAANENNDVRQADPVMAQESQAIDGALHRAIGLGADPAMQLQFKEYKPPRSEMLRNHQIELNFLSIGMTIRVGCKTIPFTSVEEGMKELTRYVLDPYEATRHWEKVFSDADKL